MVAFSLLYVTEGIPLGFTAIAIATQMRRQGLGPEVIGSFVAMFYLPWSFKFAIGPFVDIFSSDKWGRRRVWIIGAQTMMMLTLLYGMGIDFTTEIKLFTVLLLLHNIFGATQDVAIDALACGVLRESERGFANGLMFGSSFLGQAIGGSGVLYLSAMGKQLAYTVNKYAFFSGQDVEALGLLSYVAHYDFRLTFLFVIGAILMVTLFVAVPMKEPRLKLETKYEGSKWNRFICEVTDYLTTVFKAFFGSKNSVAGVILALVPPGALALSLALQSNLAVELGLSDEEIGHLNLVSTILAASGCVAGGFVSDLFDRRKVLGLYFALTVIPGLILAWYMNQHGWIMPIDVTMPDRPEPPEVLIKVFWIANIVFSLVHGFMYGTRSAIFMDICKPEVAATQFTAYMALLNFTISYSAWWQGKAIECVGYPKTLLLDSLAGLVCLAILPFVKKQNIQPKSS